MEPESIGSVSKPASNNRGTWVAVVGALTVLILADLGFLHWKLFVDTPRPMAENAVSTSIAENGEPRTTAEVCPASCLPVIQEATAAVSLPSPYPEPAPPVIQQNVPASQKGEFFIPIGSGSTEKKTWTEITGAAVTIDTANYQGKRTVTWEAALKVLSGNGTVHARLKNMDTGVWVAGTEITASSDPAIQVTSGEFALAEGKITYRVEMYTDTGYTATIESGRIKIVVE